MRTTRSLRHLVESAGGMHAWGVCVVGGVRGGGGMCARGGGVYHARPCGQTDTCENITFANFVCGR